jgi:hypothetical protein
MKRSLISIPILMKNNFKIIFEVRKCYVYEMFKPFRLVLSGTLSVETGPIHLDKILEGPSFEEMILKDKKLLNFKNNFEVNNNEIVEATIVTLNNVTTATSLLYAPNFIHAKYDHDSDLKTDLAVKNCIAIGLNVKYDEYFIKIKQLRFWCLIGKFNKFPAPKSLHLSNIDKKTAFVMDYNAMETRSVYGNCYFHLILHLESNMLLVDVQATKNEIINKICAIYKCNNNVLNCVMKNDISLQFSISNRNECSIEKLMLTVLDMLRTIMHRGEIAEKCLEIVLIFSVVIVFNNNSFNTSFTKSCPFIY